MVARAPAPGFQREGDGGSRPPGRDHRAARARSHREGGSRRWSASESSARRCMSARSASSPPPPRAMPATAPSSSPGPSRPSARPIELISGDREAVLSGLGVLSGFDNPDGVVGDLGGGQPRTHHRVARHGRGGGERPAGWPRAARPLQEFAQARREDRQGRARQAASDRGDEGPRLLRRRRHLARPGDAPSAPGPLPAQCHARLYAAAKDVADFVKLVEKGGSDGPGTRSTRCHRRGGRCSPMARWSSTN